MNNKLIKYEFNYTSPIWIVLTGLLLIYTMFSLFDFQILSGPEFEIDYWGAFYSMFLYIMIFMMWFQKIKENRLRMHSLLPISKSDLSILRVKFYGIPMIVLLGYLLLIHLILFSHWKDESSSLLAQSGLFFIVFAILIIGRDLWIAFEAKSILIKVLLFLLLSIFIIGLIGGIILLLPLLYSSVPAHWGRFTFLYSKVIFYIIAFIILLALIPIFSKRHSYFS